MKERSFPKMVSYHRFEEYNRVAHLIVNSYVTSIYPILYRLRLWDDEHIQKYLGSTTSEDIYNDAIQKNNEKLMFLEEEAVFNGEDFWKMIRDESSPVKSPREEGFIFVNMPKADYKNRELIISSLYVKNRKIHVNEDILEEASIICPTEKQRELYSIVSNFCDELERGGFSKYAPNEMMYYSANSSKIVPNINAILGIQVCYKYKK